MLTSTRRISRKPLAKALKALRSQREQRDRERREKTTTLSAAADRAPAKPKDEDVVWNHFLARRAEHFGPQNGHAPKLTKARRDLIRQRLRDGYEAPVQCLAIDGMFQCPHNLGENDRNTKYLDLEIALRVNRQVNNLERFAEIATGDRSGPGSYRDPRAPRRGAVEARRVTTGEQTIEILRRGRGI